MKPLPGSPEKVFEQLLLLDLASLSEVAITAMGWPDLDLTGLVLLEDLRLKGWARESTLALLTAEVSGGTEVAAEGLLPQSKQVLCDCCKVLLHLSW